MFQCTNCEGSGDFDTPNGGEVACFVLSRNTKIDANALDRACAKASSLRETIKRGLWITRLTILEMILMKPALKWFCYAYKSSNT